MSLLLHWDFMDSFGAFLRPGLVTLGVRGLVTNCLWVTSLGRHLLTCLGVGTTGVTLGLVNHHTPLVDLAVLLILGLALHAVHGGALLEVLGPHHNDGEHSALLTFNLPSLEHSHGQQQWGNTPGEIMRRQIFPALIELLYLLVKESLIAQELIGLRSQQLRVLGV